ncbi:MAG: hypothetical protein M1840_007716 [Geoglossum simile]|nr:MAG: hypothetical protein M1840_007716 [Geoglossum simile]
MSSPQKGRKIAKLKYTLELVFQQDFVPAFVGAEVVWMGEWDLISLLVFFVGLFTREKANEWRGAGGKGRVEVKWK